MNMNEAKQIRIEEYLHSLGYSPEGNRVVVYGTTHRSGTNRNPPSR